MRMCTCRGGLHHQPRVKASGHKERRQKKQAKQTSEHDDEHAFREFAELAKEERSREQAIFGPTLALLHRIQACKEVPCSCGKTLQPSSLLEVGAVGALRCAVKCQICQAKLDTVMALAVCFDCEIGLCSVCLLKFHG